MVSPEKAGSYTFYAHPEWNVEWGGELMLLDDDAIDPAAGIYFHRLRGASGNAWQPHLDNDDANELLMRHGVGRLVLPKPNRLVVIKGGTHYTPVEYPAIVVDELGRWLDRVPGWERRAA